MSEYEARSVTASAGIPWSAKGKTMWEAWKVGLEARGVFDKEGTKINFSRHVHHSGAEKPAEPSAEYYDDSEDELDATRDEFFQMDDSLKDDDDKSLDLSLESELNRARSTEDALKPTSSTNLSTTTVSSALMNLAKTLTGAEDDEDSDDDEVEDAEEREVAQKLSQAVASRNRGSRGTAIARSRPSSSASTESTSYEDRKSVDDEDAEKEERSDFISMMSTADLTMARDMGEEEEEEEEYLFDSTHQTASTLASVAIEAAQIKAKHPAKMFQFLSTRKGQDLVLDKLDSCCMTMVHADHKMCKNKAGFDFSMSAGCAHFSGISSEAEYQGLNTLHSQMKLAMSDDAISAVLSQSAQEAFMDMASVSLVSKEELLRNDDTSIGLNLEAVSPEAIEAIRSGSSSLNLDDLGDDDLNAITRNYQQVRSTVFAIWGNEAMTLLNSSTIQKADKVVTGLIYWLNRGDGAVYEHQIFFGYQAVVALLIGMIRKAHIRFKDPNELVEGAEHVLKMLEAIKSSHSERKLSVKILSARALSADASIHAASLIEEDEEEEDLDDLTDDVGRLRAPRALRRGKKRATGLIRRGKKKAAKIFHGSIEDFLKGMVAKLDGYRKPVGSREEAIYSRTFRSLKTAARKTQKNTVSAVAENDLARHLMNDLLMEYATKEASNMLSGSRRLSKHRERMRGWKMSVRVMALLAAKLLIVPSTSYGAMASSLVLQNLIDGPDSFLNTAIADAGNDINGYFKGAKKLAKRGAKAAKRGALHKVDKEMEKERKRRAAKVKAVISTSHLPSPILSKQDQRLSVHEREFTRRAIQSAVDYTHDLLVDGYTRNDLKSIHMGRGINEPRQFVYTIVIPEERKFRNPDMRKVTLDHAYRWVMEHPPRPSMDEELAIIRARKEGTTLPSTYRHPHQHKVWASLPAEDDPNLSKDSEGRFQYRYYPTVLRLERIGAGGEESMPKHSAYVDEEGNVIRLKTKRDKKHISLSEVFQPIDPSSKIMLRQARVDAPRYISWSFRRSFG